jgi:hypothetical protein
MEMDETCLGNDEEDVCDDNNFTAAIGDAGLECRKGRECIWLSRSR